MNHISGSYCMAALFSLKGAATEGFFCNSALVSRHFIVQTYFKGIVCAGIVHYTARCKIW